MTVFPDTQVVDSKDERRAAAGDSFRRQTPLALVAIAAVAAIVAVNAPRTQRAQAASAAPAARPAAAPASCADCGVIVSIRRISAPEPGVVGAEDGFALEVRMNDGSLRTVRHSAGGFDVGDRVRVRDDALTPGS